MIWFLIFMGVAQATPISSFADLQKFIQKGEYKTIESFLEALPAESKKHFTFVYQSRSLHGSSALNPRALVYLNRGKLVFSFNGSPEQKNFDKLEVMEFDQKESRFRFHEIVFPEGRLGAKHEFNLNDSKCLHCHRQDPRPIWDSYDLWPGVYGSTDGKMQKGTWELKKYQEFLNKNAKTGRYGNLHWDFSKSPVYPFVVSRKLNYKFNSSPNEELGLFISLNNADRIIRLIRQSPNYEKYKFWLFSFRGCFKFRPTEELLSGIRSASARGFKVRLARHFDQYNTTNRKGFERFYPEEIAKAEVISQAFGISLEEWASGLEANSYSFESAAGSSVESYVLPKLFEAVVDDTPELQALKKQKLSPAKFCESINKRREEELKANPLATDDWKSYYAQKGLSVEATRPIDRCVSCHTGDHHAGPTIPFDSDSQLRVALQKGGYPRGTLYQEMKYRLKSKGADRMPLNEILSAAEISKIETYLANLAERPY
ncbi:MAG: hypothetical protein IT289_01580 [Oligoflexia bacterium]|nr:hypothetical protein [Oligoflexia bacterium]